MTLVKDPIIGKVTFEGMFIYNEGTGTYSFAIDADEYFKDNEDEDEDFSKESTTEKLITELHQLFGKPKARYRITSITLSYSEFTWDILI